LEWECERRVYSIAILLLLVTTCRVTMMKYSTAVIVGTTAVALLLSGSAVEATVSANKIDRYWTDAQDILDNVDQYQALWVKFHNCVWSECAVDDNDDDGEGRDGDENWYQGRIQEFCANAAYSLYGIPKNWISAPLMGCSQGHYIDSFFTYNSSDIFLRAMGDSKTNNLFDDDNLIWGVGKGGAGCHDNGDGSSSALGCTVDGKYGLATFGDEYCDGNYFYSIEAMHAYSSRMKTSCHLIYGRNGWVSGSSESVAELLSNSWSCDVELYPHGCPDPYGKKKIKSDALHAASKGWNPSLAYNNSRFKRPIRITACFFLVLGIFFFLFSYRLSNKDRIKKRGGGLRGMILVAREDYENYKRRREQERRDRLQAEYDEDNKVAKGWRRRRKSKSRKDETPEERRQRKKDKKKKKRKSRSRSARSKSREPEGEGDGTQYGRYEEDYHLPEVA